MTDEEIAVLPDQRGVRSWAFEPYLELHDDVINAALYVMLRKPKDCWLKSLKRKPNIERQKNFDSCLRVILINLMRVRALDDTLTVGIPSGKGAMQEALRYMPSFFSVHYHREALFMLQEHDLVWMVKAGHNQEDYAETARYALTEAACDMLPLIDLKLNHFTRAKRNEVILLKNDKHRLTKYVDTSETHNMRINLRRLNDILKASEIGTNGPLNPFTDLQNKYSGEGTDLYRVFNNSDFGQGGRFYGGWWEYAKKHLRRKITIDGQPTVEADFKGLHPAILFAQNGLPIPPDPYALVPGVADSDVLRSHAKITFLALLNAGKRGTSEPREFDPRQHGMTKVAFQKLVKNAFPMLPDIFGTGIGLRLQREDSDLAEKIMLQFADRNIPVLPVHDSFIIAAQHSDEIVQVMQTVFFDTYGQKPTVTVTPSTI